MALRRLAGAATKELLDPWRLAAVVGLKVVDDEFFKVLERQQGPELTLAGRNHWSGGVYPRPLPNGMLLCFLNPWHSRRRRKITLMEEILHVHLGHKPTKLILSADGLEVRDFDRSQEAEAYGIGAAALIPWVTLFPELNKGSTIQDLAEAYDVTTQLVLYRIKITGAYRLYISRQ